MKVYKVKKKKSKAKKWILLALSFMFTIGGIFGYLHFVANPIIIKSTYAQIETQATSYVSDAIEDSLIETGYSYSDFVTINKNAEGNVTSVIANTLTLNILAREVARSTQIYIDRIIDQGVSIPIGTFTGLNFLAGRGSKLNFKLVPIGSIHVGFKSDFLSAGINQTLHKISIVVTTDMTVIMPLSSEKISFQTDLVFSENLIVGEVPGVYFSGDFIN